MAYLFAGTLFLSAALLFIVEPLIAKMVLPLLGGSPAVWNTCLVFFQAALLGGYLYAHALSTWLSFRLQAAVHIGLLCLGLLVLPLGLPDRLVELLPHSDNPVPWLLQLLAATIGLPFFVVSASAPLLQKWYAGGEARDPYHLYAASNLGSMLALLAYPLLLEPGAGLKDQSLLWTVGYAGLVALTAACAVAAQASGLSQGPDSEPNIENRELTLGRRLRWIALALAPSSLLLGVTTYVTTDIAAVPLLWVIPLALYLLSFILVFARKQLIPHDWMVYLLPPLALVAALTQLRGGALPSWQLIPIHWLTLLVAALVCHGELARDRPPARHLTEFYLWISVGGVLGGLFNALLAPLLFQGSVLEYPLALVLACWLRPGPRLRESTSTDRWLDLLTPLGIGALALGMSLGAAFLEPERARTARAASVGVIGLLCFVLANRPARFALALGVALLTLSVGASGGGRTLASARNFFGLVRVTVDPKGQFHLLHHGSTTHGLQKLGPDGKPERNSAALSYFHSAGPVGQVIDAFHDRRDLPPHIAVTGLGVGALAGYARPGEAWTFYEIDPAIERVARDQALFTFLADAEARGAKVDVKLGDARLRLRDAPEHGYGLIVLDAFSSDSVPMHLISRQALDLYNRKRARGGLLVFNITNRYLDLEPVLARLAEDAGMVAFARQESRVDLTEADNEAGRYASHWVVLADRVEDVGPIAGHPRWQRLEASSRQGLWTDDFANLLGVFRWR